MKMIASCRWKDTNETVVIKDDTYKSKKEFRKDCNRNGLIVIGRIFLEGEETKSTRLYNIGSK